MTAKLIDGTKNLAEPASLVRGESTRQSEGDKPGWAELLVDLARLELAIDQVFDGPGMEGGGLTPTRRFGGCCHETGAR